MVDLSNKSTDSNEITTEENELKKCADCGTSKTPLWRSGPAGPKSLCNACGIRSRKKGRVFLGITKNVEKKTKHATCTTKTTSSSSDSNSSDVTTTTSFSSGESGPTLHERLISLGREVMMMRKRRSTVGIRGLRMRRKLCEEEQAAVLLMALSYGSVYA